VALRRLKAAVNRRHLRLAGKVPLGTIITDLVMKHLPPVPNENAAVSEVDGLEVDGTPPQGNGPKG